MLTQDEVGLFTVAAAFGLGFAGIIPAYILAIRELFPASEAYWRIPTFLLCSGSGMAIGGWMAGVLYDHFGTYGPAFAAGVAANAVNLVIVGLLVFRQQQRAARFASTAPLPAFQSAERCSMQPQRSSRSDPSAPRAGMSAIGLGPHRRRR
mgnify:CR=1 FL=1